MVRRGADESDSVATLNIVGKVYKNSQMGVPAPDQNKMLFHESHAPDTSFLLRHSSEEEKNKKRFLGIEDRRFFVVSQKGNAV
jgi:hypothetical protein